MLRIDELVTEAHRVGFLSVSTSAWNWLLILRSTYRGLVDRAKRYLPRSSLGISISSGTRCRQTCSRISAGSFFSDAMFEARRGPWWRWTVCGANKDGSEDLSVKVEGIEEGSRGIEERTRSASQLAQAMTQMRCEAVTERGAQPFLSCLVVARLALCLPCRCPTCNLPALRPPQLALCLPHNRPSCTDPALLFSNLALARLRDLQLALALPSCCPNFSFTRPALWLTCTFTDSRFLCLAILLTCTSPDLHFPDLHFPDLHFPDLHLP